jgi:sulfite dehydrogenase (cytochrome) subunit A
MNKIAFGLLFFTAISCNEISQHPGNGTAADEIVISEGKKDMILLTERPPNFETPLKYFLLDFTPNDLFFVRWHLAGLPSRVDEDTFRLRVSGHVKNSISLSLADLKKRFPPFSINALCACAGNARSFFDPRVPGAQWKNGAMGNARWTGVRLKDILEMAGCKEHALYVSFNGMDEPPLSSVPDFVKSLDCKHAMDGEVMVAYEMNGEPLPLLNGYPLKLVVPGWYATYWVGMLNEIIVHADTFRGYWMDKAYLVPKDAVNGNEGPDSLAKQLVPISKMDVRALFVAPVEGTSVRAGAECLLQGIAFDGGDGIATVELSADSGRTWKACRLHGSLGKYSWRRWSIACVPMAGKQLVMVRATNASGETQPARQWNRSGYMRNEIESLTLNGLE